MTHRAFDMLTQYEAERAEGKQEVVKNLNAKNVKVGRSVMGFSRGQEWQWSQAARDRYDTEQLDQAKAYAEQM